MKLKNLTIPLIFATITTATTAHAYENYASKIKINSMTDLEKCEKDHSYDTGTCFEPFEKFIRKNPKTMFANAKKARRVFASWVMLPYFEMPISKSKDAKLCSDEDFQTSLFNATGQSSDSKAYKMAKSLINGKCGPALVGGMLKELDSYSGSDFVALVCPAVLKAGKTHKNCEAKPVVAEEKPTSPETLPKIEKNKIKLSEAKVYSGPESARLSIAGIEGQTDMYLIKFDGIKGPWKGKAMLHKSRSTGNNGEADYWTENEGKQWVSVSVRDCYNGYCQYKVYAPQGPSNSLNFGYDKVASKNVKLNEILNSF